MSENISFQDADRKKVSGRFEVSHGMSTVTARNGRTKKAVMDEGMHELPGISRFRSQPA
jgi:hypothetical protein